MSRASSLTPWALATLLVAAAAVAAPTANGRVIYPVAGGTTPQHRAYSASTNAFATAAATVAGATNAGWFTDRAAPTRNEHLAGYVTTGGVLYVLRWDGTTWTAQWNVTVGGDGVNGRRFDIAYEAVTGDAVVVYSNNSSGLNELRYRVWNGTTWTAATNLDAARLTGVPTWVKLLPRAGSDEVALTVADNGTTAGNDCALTTLIWSGTTWGNEASSAHSTSLYSTTGQLVQNELFDMAWERLTGSLMVVLTQSNGVGQYYRRFDGGTRAWDAAATSFGSTRTPPLQMFAASDPNSNAIVAGWNRSASTNVYAQVWTGAAWSTSTAVSTGTTGATPAINRRTVVAQWLAVGGTSYPVVLWGTATAGTVGYNRATVSGTTVTWSGTASSAAFTGTFGAWAWMDAAVDTASPDTLELTFSDANSDLWARRLVVTAGPTLTWTADSSAALTTTLQGVTTQNFAFAYDRLTSSLTLGNALTTDVPSATICYNAPATDVDFFTLLASAADTVTGVTVALTGTTSALSSLSVTDNAGTVLGPTVATPSASNPITFTTPFAAPTGTAAQYRVKVTPNPAAAPGTYTFTGNVTAVTDSAAFAKVGADGVAGTLTVDNAAPGEVTGLNTSAVTSTTMTVGWTNPGSDFSSALVVRGTTGVTGVPAKGSTYTVGAQLPGFANPSEQVVAAGVTSGTFGDSGLAVGTTYFYRVFVRDACGIWSPLGAQVSQATVAMTLTVGNGTPVPASAIVCPGDLVARDVSAFTLVVAPAGSTDTVTSLTVDFTNGGVNLGAASGLGTASVTNDATTTTYSSVSSPGGSQLFTLAPTVGVTTTSAQYRVRAVAASHASMPAPPGANYPVTAIITAVGHVNAGTVTLGNTIAGSATVTIDNSASPDVSALTSSAPATGQTQVTWNNPAAGTSPYDFGSTVVVLRNTVSVTDRPAEGTASYTVGQVVGTSTVACAGNLAACAESGLPSGTTYYYKVFTRDSCNNWSVGAQTSVTTLDARSIVSAPGATITSCTAATLSAPFVGDSNSNGSTLFEWGLTATGPWTLACTGVVGASPRSCAASGLTNNAAHYFRVTFTDADGVVGTNPQVVGPFSTFDCRVAPATPSASANSCSQVTVSAPFTGDWNTNSTSTFARGTSATGPWTATACGTVTGLSPRPCIDTGVTASTGYYYQVTYADADGVNGSAAVVTASAATTPACAGTLSITTVSAGQPVGSTVTAGSSGNYIGKMTLSASGGAITVTDVAIANTGTGVAQTDFLDLILYDDANGNGVYDVLTDTTVVGTAAWSASRARYLARNMAYVVTSPTTRTLFFALNVASSATTGATFGLQVSSTDVTVAAPSTASGTLVTGNTFTVAAAPSPGGASNAPMVLLLNPAEGATVSGNFRVQVQVDNPGGAALTALKLSKNGGADAYAAYAFNLTTDKKTQYSVGVNAAVYETTIPVAPSVGGWAPGSYSLKLQATNANGSSTSSTAVINVKAAGVGDGNLLARDNGSQLCLDCHAIPTHSSQETSYNYGSWGMNCRTCHQPHNTRNIYLVREQIATPNSGGKAVAFYNTTGRAANSFATSTGPAVPGTGICEVCHTKTSETAAVGTGTATFTSGGTTVTCTGCGWTAAIVGFLVKQSSDPDTAWTKVQTFVSATQVTLAEGYRGASGASVAFFTRAPRYRNTGDSAQHYAGACTGCHAHSGGFKAGESGGGVNCNGCHQAIWDGMTGGVAKAYKHSLGNAPATNASFNDTATTWANPLSGNAAANRSCVNMCHGDHVHNVPPGTTHEYNTYVNAASQASRAAASRTTADKDKTDYENTASGGLCLSCHTNPVDAAHPALGQPAFQASAHNYTTFSTYGAWAFTLHDGSSFARNCTKCHAGPTEVAPTVSGAALTAVHSSDNPSLLTGTTNPAGTPATYVCMNCHGNGTVGTNRSGKDLATQVAKVSSHPTNADTVHSTVTEDGTSAFGNMLGSSRHVNCLDCHDAHQAKAGAHVTPGNLAGPAVAGVSGAQLSTNPAFWTAPVATNFTKKTLVSGTDVEATLCFKCHSAYYWGTTATSGRGVPPNSPSGTTYVTGTAAFTTGSTTVTGTGTTWTASHVGWVIKNNANGVWYLVTGFTSATSLTISPAAAATVAASAYTLQMAETDTAMEFNPANSGTWATAGTANAWSAGETAGSYHPILATTAGNLGQVKLTNLVTTNFPWSTTVRNTMTCSDCHESNTATDPNGPHGSTAGFILRGPNTTWNATLTLGATIPAGTFCLNCHQNTFTNSRFPDHSRNNHYVACFNCHAAIPHGGPRMGMLNPAAGTNTTNLPAIASWDGRWPYWQGGTTNRLYLVNYPTNGTTNWAQSNCGCNGTSH